MGNASRFSRCALVAVALLLPQTALEAQQPVTQPAMKADFLYKFVKFAQWPGHTTDPLVLCVLDDAAVDRALEQLVRGGTIGGRTIEVIRISRDRQMRSCHLLYVSGVDAGLAAVLEEVKGAPVLTVSDGEQFPRLGGVIGVFLDGGKMRFAVNADAAQRAGIQLSAKLLTLAKLVKDPRGAQP